MTRGPRRLVGLFDDRYSSTDKNGNLRNDPKLLLESSAPGFIFIQWSKKFFHQDNTPQLSLNSDRMRLVFLTDCKDFFGKGSKQTLDWHARISEVKSSILFSLAVAWVSKRIRMFPKYSAAASFASPRSPIYYGYRCGKWRDTDHLSWRLSGFHTCVDYPSQQSYSIPWDSQTKRTTKAEVAKKMAVWTVWSFFFFQSWTSFRCWVGMDTTCFNRDRPPAPSYQSSNFPQGPLWYFIGQMAGMAFLFVLYVKGGLFLLLFFWGGIMFFFVLCFFFFRRTRQWFPGFQWSLMVFAMELDHFFRPHIMWDEKHTNLANDLSSLSRSSLFSFLLYLATKASKAIVTDFVPEVNPLEGPGRPLFSFCSY